MAYIAQLEPEILLRQFLVHPPLGFRTECTASSMPCFVAPFDLLTTADTALRQRITRLPGYRFWGRWLRWRTRFAGCTVTEFAPLPVEVPARQLADELVDSYGGDCALLVIKDIAPNSPLLDEAAIDHAEAFAQACKARGCVLLEGMPLAWVAIDFESIDAYLERLSHSRRKNIRRKLRSRDALSIDCVRTGAVMFDDDTVLAEFHSLYCNVYAQSEIHFDLLSPAFFAGLFRDSESAGLVFTYRHAGKLIGWNLCYEHDGKLIDKYIGFAYPQAREHSLYVVSWMENLEYARRRGLSHYVAGWTDAEIKRQLGAHFSTTRHAVYVRNPLLRFAFRRFSHLFECDPMQLHDARDNA
ncbi:MAG: GNAT family N-acetyltransferase [Rhodanobacter sp.]